jgi:hypothetical protein
MLKSHERIDYKGGCLSIPHHSKSKNIIRKIFYIR